MTYEDAADAAADRFWTFSVAVYGKPGVEAACLALQDGLGLDANILLLCCWGAAAGAPALGGRSLGAAFDAVRPWRERAVTPLRDIRRDLKRPVSGIADAQREALRRRVAELELEAERTAQAVLVATVGLDAENGSAADDRLAAGAANLADYLALAGVDPATEQRANLALVLGAALGVPAENAGIRLASAIRSRADGDAAL
jgi:uncharacterized protein (TIGR02444 family)